MLSVIYFDLGDKTFYQTKQIYDYLGFIYTRFLNLKRFIMLQKIQKKKKMLVNHYLEKVFVFFHNVEILFIYKFFY